MNSLQTTTGTLACKHPLVRKSLRRRIAEASSEEERFQLAIYGKLVEESSEAWILANGWLQLIKHADEMMKCPSRQEGFKGVYDRFTQRIQEYVRDAILEMSPERFVELGKRMEFILDAAKLGMADPVAFNLQICGPSFKEHGIVPKLHQYKQFLKNSRCPTISDKHLSERVREMGFPLARRGNPKSVGKSVV